MNPFAAIRHHLGRGAKIEAAQIAVKDALVIVHANLAEVLDLARALNEKLSPLPVTLKEIQMSQSTVSAEIATLSTDVAALTTAVQAAVTGFATLNAQIAALQASGGLSADDAASLTASVNSIASDTATLAGATPAAA